MSMSGLPSVVVSSAATRGNEDTSDEMIKIVPIKLERGLKITGIYSGVIHTICSGYLWC